MEENWYAFYIAIMTEYDVDNAFRALNGGEMPRKRGRKRQNPDVDRQIYEMTMEMTYREVGEKLGIGIKSVQEKARRYRQEVLGIA